MRRKEKQCRKLQQELTQEREKCNQLSTKWQKDVQDLQAQLYEENQSKIRLQMELDSKDSEIEQLHMRVAILNSETASISSTDNDNNNSNDNDVTIVSTMTTASTVTAASTNHQYIDTILEGWLSVPNKQNIRRHGWKRQYVVVSSRKIIFYNSESDKHNSDPAMILDLSKVTIFLHLKHIGFFKKNCKNNHK